MSIEEVREQFDLPRLASFTKYTKRYPPQHVLVASYFGYGKPSAGKASESDNADFIQELMASFHHHYNGI
jgi:hypothetical protein